MTTARHVIFGTGAIGLATLDALRRRGETVRLVNRSGHTRPPARPLRRDGALLLRCAPPGTARVARDPPAGRGEQGGDDTAAH